MPPVAAAPVASAMSRSDAVAGEGELESNPFPVTSPQHAEYQSVQRAAAVERLGTGAARLMRLADFKAEAYNHDVAAAHRHEAATRRAREGDSPSRSRYAPSTTTGFHEPLPMRVTIFPAPAAAAPPDLTNGCAGRREEINAEDKTMTLDSTTVGLSSTNGDDSPSTHDAQAKKDTAAITCSTPLHGGHAVLFGTADGAMHLVHRSNMAAASQSEWTALQFVDDSERDRRTTDRARNDGVMGREDQCKGGDWVSKRLHRAVRAAQIDELNRSSSCSNGAFAVCVCLAPGEAYAALGLSDGTVQIWSYLTMEGIAMLPPITDESTTTDDGATTNQNKTGGEHHKSDATAAGAARVVRIHFLSVEYDNSRAAAAGEGSGGGTSSCPATCTLLILYASGAVATARFFVGSGTSALPPPYRGAMLSTTVSPTTREASMPFPDDDSLLPRPSIEFMEKRPRLIRGTVVPNSFSVSLSDACAYVGTREGEWFVVDLTDVQLAMRWSVAEFLSTKCVNRIGPPHQSIDKTANRTTPTKRSHHSNSKSVAPSADAVGIPLRRGSEDSSIFITSSDVHECWIVLGLSSGESVLLQRTKGRLSRSVYAARQYIDHLDGAERRSSSSTSCGVTAELVSRICPNSNTVITIVQGSEIVMWSLAPELQFSVLHQSRLPPTASGGNAPLDVSVHVLTDAMELWSAGADGINFAFMSQFPRTLHEVGATQLHADRIAESNGIALIDWHVVVSRMGAESELGVQAATDALCRASEADIFRRYFWKLLQFRLEHQLQRKYGMFTEILSRTQQARIGRNAFRMWQTFRNDRLRMKRNTHASAALEALVSQQRMHGALLLWQRYRARQRRQRESEARAWFLLQATQRRQRTIAYSRLRAFARLQQLRRRWLLFAESLELQSQKTSQRSTLMRWWAWREKIAEHRQAVCVADDLSRRVASKHVVAGAYNKWTSFIERQRRRAVLRSWSITLGISRTTLICAQYFHAWIDLVYMRRAEGSAVRLSEASALSESLEGKISCAAPRVQRMRKVAVLKGRLSELNARMEELREVQDGIASRVTHLRLAERGDGGGVVHQPGSPLFAGASRRQSNLSNDHHGSQEGGGVGSLDSTNRSVTDGASVVEQQRGSSPPPVEVSAAEQFPDAMLRLKKRTLDLCTDQSLIVHVVEKCRGGGTGSFSGANSAAGSAPTKYFLATLQHLEKRVRDVFRPTSLTTDDHKVHATSSEACNNGAPTEDLCDAADAHAAAADVWIPEETTEADVRATMIRLSETQPAVARGILREIISLVVSFDCIPIAERRNTNNAGIPERIRAVFLHHADLLEILHDALLRCGTTS